MARASATVQIQHKTMIKLAILKMRPWAVIALSIAQSRPVRWAKGRLFKLEGWLVYRWTGRWNYTHSTARAVWVTTYVLLMALFAIAFGLYNLFLSRI